MPHEPPSYPCRIESLLDHGAARPDHLAIRHGARAWTYAEARRERDRRAGLLIEAGLAVGDTVVTTAPITDDLVLSFFACAQAGLVFFHLSQQFAPAEIAALAARVRPALALVADGAPEGTTPAAPRARALALPGTPGAAAIAEAARRSATGAHSAPVAIRATSGTTGQRPKLVVRSHASLTAPSAHPVPYETADDRFLLPNQHHFMFGDVCRVLGHGATVVLRAEAAIDRVEAEWAAAGVTIVYATPALLTPLVARDRPLPADLRLRAFRVGSAALTGADRLAVEARYGVPVIVEYASTEASYLLSADPATPRGSIGRPMAGVEVKNVDEGGAEVPIGATGELIVRSPGMMLGYLDDPEETAEVLRDGWYHTGDLARRDAAGWYWLEGRRALRISVGGYKVLPEEVEEVLLAHPGVREAAVVAMPDRLRGEVVRAFVVPEGDAPTSGELRRHCAAHLARYKIPRRIEFRDALPRSPLGKVLRNRL